MIETLILAFIAGAILGVFFFGGLWLTVHKGLKAKTPAVWFVLSFLLRMAVALSGFYAITKIGEWQHLPIAMLGFVLARVVLIRITPKVLSDSAKEQGHAS